MKTFLLLTILVGLACLGLVKPASAQTVPDVRGLQPFTAQTNFMSLTGYVRWQYFIENDNTWISRAEAARLVSTQTGVATTAAANNSIK
ncbi:MAG TPA: hypothetical protein VGL77_10295 [Armatimonadota bacterium]